MRQLVKMTRAFAPRMISGGILRITFAFDFVDLVLPFSDSTSASTPSTVRERDRSARNPFQVEKGGRLTCEGAEDPCDLIYL